MTSRDGTIAVPGATDDGRATVLHVINTGGPGGAETVCVNIARSLDARIWRSVAVVPDDGWIYRELRAAGIETAILPDTRWSDVPGYAAGLLRLMRRQRVAIVHAHLFAPSVMASALSLMTGVPVVCTFHGEGDLHPRERGRRLKFELLNRAKRVVFVSEALRSFFLQTGLLKREHTAVIPNGVSFQSTPRDRDPSVRAEFGAAPEHFLVGALGNLRPAKGYDVLLRAAAILKERSSSYRFVIVGRIDSDFGREIVALSESLGVSGIVRFAGFRSDVDSVLGALDLYALTSRSEGFSISVVEALGAGLPAVATRCGGPEEILADEQTGLLVENGSPTAIADAIERLRLDAPLRHRLAAAGRAMAHDRFALSRQVAAYEDVYRSCLARGSVADPRGVKLGTDASVGTA